MASTLTLLDGDEVRTLEATLRDGRAFLPEEAVEDALGFHLDAQGLCRGNVCVPVRDREALVHDEGLDLEVLAQLLGRPLALDVEVGAGALGTAATTRAAALAGSTAPDFQLPDLAGRTHALSDHRGKKVLLIAYASW